MQIKYRKGKNVVTYSYRITVIGIRQINEENFRQALSEFNELIRTTNYSCVLEKITNDNGKELVKELYRGGTNTETGEKWIKEFT